MASRLEQLPVRLLGQICEDLETLGVRHLASLMECNKGLHAFVQPLVYGNEDHRNAAMRAACLTGNLDTMDLVLCFGSSPSYVAIEWAPGCVAKCSTLFFAAKGGSLLAFEALIARGARLDDDDDEDDNNKQLARKQLNRMLKFLCRDGNHDLLEMFFKFGVADQVGCAWAADQCLVPAILARATYGTVEMLIDYGADPGQTRRLSNRSVMCPISAAMRSGIEEVFELLLAKAPRIDRPCSSNCPSLRFRLPIR